MPKLVNEDEVVTLKRGEKWTTQMISTLKLFKKQHKLKYKDLACESNWSQCKSLQRSLTGKHYIINEFLTRLKAVKTKKCSVTADFRDDLKQKTDTNAVFEFKTFEKVSMTEMSKTSQSLLAVIKCHLRNRGHPINKVIDEFRSIFSIHYLSLIAQIKPMQSLYEEWKDVWNGESSSRYLNNETYESYIEIFSKENFRILIAQAFDCVKVILACLIDSVSKFYHGLVTIEQFEEVRDQVHWMLSSLLVQDEMYTLLFTFSRVLTLKDESQLYKCIQKANFTNKRFKSSGFTLLEELYNQIHPDFREVKFVVENTNPLKWSKEVEICNDSNLCFKKVSTLNDKSSHIYNLDWLSIEDTWKGGHAID